MLWFLLFKLKQDAVIEILGLLGWIIILLFQTDSLLLGIQTNIIFFFFNDCPIGLQFVDARVLLEGSFALQDVFVRTKDFWSFFLRFFLFFGLSLLIFTILGFDVIILLWSIFRILPLFIILQIRRFIFFLNLFFILRISWSLLIIIGVFSNDRIILLFNRVFHFGLTSRDIVLPLLVFLNRLFTFQ